MHSNTARQSKRKATAGKQIHHEPCDYYTFGNKIEAEQRDYERLQSTSIRIPRMLDVDVDAERIVKEYIEGPTMTHELFTVISC